jgi:hypothetical protein
MSKWISIKDMLPKEDSFILAAKFFDYIEDIDACVCDFYHGKFHVNTDGLDASNYDGGAIITMNFEPTHWMRIPKSIK